MQQNCLEREINYNCLKHAMTWENQIIDLEDRQIPEIKLGEIIQAE